jgi:hypothetical protein
MTVKLMRHARRRAALAAVLAMAGAAKAQAAGGPHVVDDAAISPPGECKIESWASFSSGGDRLLTAVPSCTFNVLPWAEFGVQIDRSHMNGVSAIAIGPYVKAAVLSIAEARAALSIASGFAYSATSGRIETAFVNVPVTVRLREGSDLHVNLGWERDRIAERGFALWGASVEQAITEDVSAVLEVFDRFGAAAGVQLGVRPTVVGGRVDLDLLVGRNVAGAGATWVVAGVTARF